MGEQSQPADRAAQLQARAGRVLERYAASMMGVQQLLNALGATPPQLMLDGLARFGQHRGGEAYREVGEHGARFLARSIALGASYQSHAPQRLRALLPPLRYAEIGELPPVPQPPAGADPTEWAAWYLAYAAWTAQQQVWTARVYQLIQDEVSAGGLPRQAAGAACEAVLRDQLPGYLAELAEAGLDLVEDGLGTADESVRALTDALLGHPAVTDLTVSVHGLAGTIARTELAIENNRGEPAEVECQVRPVDGIGLAIQPSRFRLAAGQVERVSIRVALPDAAPTGSLAAGTIYLARYGETPLRVQVLATVSEPPHQHLSVRALDRPAEPV